MRMSADGNDEKIGCHCARCNGNHPTCWSEKDNASPSSLITSCLTLLHYHSNRIFCRQNKKLVSYLNGNISKSTPCNEKQMPWDAYAFWKDCFSFKCSLWVVKRTCVACKHCHRGKFILNFSSNWVHGIFHWFILLIYKWSFSWIFFILLV